MLRFILGVSGTGKSTRVLRIAGELANEGKPVMLIVPDQSTFEYEKSLLDAFGAKKAERAEVFGFSRLCRHCFETKGISDKNVIDDGTGAVVMSLALEELSEKLDLLSPRGGKSLVEVMLQTVEDLKKSTVSSDDLRTAAQTVSDNTLKTKLKETALIADTFDALVSQGYVDPMDDLTRLYEILLNDNPFRNYTVIFDGFSGFTAQQLKIVRLLMKDCENVFVALTLDPQAAEEAEELFTTSNSTKKILSRFADLDSVPVARPIELLKPFRFKNAELAALEANAFRLRHAEYKAEPENISIYQADDIYNECEFAAQKIKELVIDGEYLYSDISVICNDTEPYRGVLGEIFDKYEIPYFSDRRADVEVKPVIRLVNSIFRLILFGFEREDMLALLKTGLTPFDVTQISNFENYVFLWNISGARLKKEFAENPRGYKTEFSDDDRAALKEIEAVRRATLEPILAFKESARDKTGLEISRLFYALLEGLGVPDALSSLCDKLERAGKAADGSEQIRIWNLFMNALDKTAAASAEKTVNVKKYYELLSLQIAHMKLESIPQTIDCVTVTTAQRVRTSRQRASFLIGCEDGVFPAVPHTSGIFSQFELKELALNDIELGDDFEALGSLEILMAYSCMTSPSERLYISYYASDASGAVHNPSEIVLQCLRVFPSLKITDSMDGSRGSLLALRPAFDAAVLAIGRGEEVSRELLDVFGSRPEYAERLDAVMNAKRKLPFAMKNPENAEKLFGKRLNISASQIEKFYLCRFSYFCNYGLHVSERRRAEVNPMEYGTLVHYLLEKFFTSFKKEQYSAISDEEIADFVNKTLNEYAGAYFGSEQMKTPSFTYRLSVIAENAAMLIRHTADELGQSGFDVFGCELNIGGDIPARTVRLSDGHALTVRGRVDRVDTAVRGGVEYLRVIDYKTGTKEFKLSDILYGLNVQMLLYLHIITEHGARLLHGGKADANGKNPLPAGILYVPATVPQIPAEKAPDAAAYAKELNGKLRMNGLLLNDADIIHAMDKSDMGVYIPVKLKSGLPVSKSSLATLEEFGKIFKKVDLLAADMGRELYGGRVEARPLKGSHDSCEYCPYDSVCVYRQSPPKRAFSLDNAEVIKEITDRLEAEDANNYEKGGV